MTALTKDRLTSEREGRQVTDPLAAGATEAPSRAREMLRGTFGFDSFRPLQGEIVSALLGTLLRIGTALVFAAIAVFTAITVWLARTEITGIAGAILLAVAAVIAAAVILAVHVHLLTVAASLGLKTAVLRAFVGLACILAHMILLGHMLFVHVIKVSH